MVLKTPASLYITFPVAEMDKAYFPFTYTLFMLINYTNHAVNLILYILTSATFRRDFKQFFCLWLGAQRAPSINRGPGRTASLAVSGGATKENGRLSISVPVTTPLVTKHIKTNNAPIETDDELH